MIEQDNIYQVLTRLPALVEIDIEERPTAFWWKNTRHAIVEHLCHWDDRSCISAHWLVRTEKGQDITLIYDRAEGLWFIEWFQS